MRARSTAWAQAVQTHGDEHKHQKRQRPGAKSGRGYHGWVDLKSCRQVTTTSVEHRAVGAYSESGQAAQTIEIRPDITGVGCIFHDGSNDLQSAVGRRRRLRVVPTSRVSAVAEAMGEIIGEGLVIRKGDRGNVSNIAYTIVAAAGRSHCNRRKDGRCRERGRHQAYSCAEVETRHRGTHFIGPHGRGRPGGQENQYSGKRTNFVPLSVCNSFA